MAEEDLIDRKLGKPEVNNPASICNGTAEAIESEVGHELVKNLMDTSEVKEKNLNKMKSEKSDLHQQEKDFSEALKNSNGTVNSEISEECARAADCSNATSIDDTNISGSKPQEESIQEQAQKILGKNFPATLNTLTQSWKISCHGKTESENLDSLDPEKNYLFQKLFKKCPKPKELPLGLEVADAYEELVHGKEDSSQSVNVAARKLLSDNSESRVPEYFQKTLRKEKVSEGSQKVPIPRSDFRSPLNIGLKQKDYLKNTVKPTLTPCSHFVKEVTMDVKMINHVSSSVVTVNKDGTVQPSPPGIENKSTPTVTKNQTSSTSEENENLKCDTITSTTQKSCANEISKKADSGTLRNKSMGIVRKPRNSVSSSQNSKYSSSDDSDDTTGFDDSSGSLDKNLHESHLRKSTPKTFQNIQSHSRRHYYSARKTLPSLTNKKRTSENINKTIQNSYLHAANGKLPLPDSVTDCVVRNYILVPVEAEKKSSDSTSESSDSHLVTNKVNKLDSAGTLKVQINGLISKNKSPVKSVNNLLKKTSRKVVGIRRGKRKRKAPSRFQSSQSSDEEKQPVPRKKSLMNRRKAHISQINKAKERAQCALQIKALKNKVTNRLHGRPPVGVEQENILAQHSIPKFILTSNDKKQLKFVKSSKANLLIPSEVVRGKTVNELLTIADRSKTPLKNGERPLSILLPTSTAPSNLLSQSNTTHTQGFLLRESVPIVFPTTNSDTSQGTDIHKIVDEDSKSTDSSTNSLQNTNKSNETDVNVSKNLPDAVSGVNQTNCAAKKIREFAEIQQSKMNSTSNDNNLSQTGFVKERQTDNIFSMLNAIKQESEKIVPSEETDKTTTNSDNKPLVRSVDGPRVSATGVYMRVEPVSCKIHQNILNTENSIITKDNSNKQVMQPVVASKNTVSKTDASLSNVVEDCVTTFQEKVVSDNSQEDSTIKDNLNSKVDTNSVEDMSVDFTPDIIPEKNILNTQDTLIKPSLEEELRRKGNCYNALKSKRRRKLTSQYRAKLMRQKKKQKRLEAMSDQKQSVPTISDVEPCPTSRSSSVSTIASLDEVKLLTGTSQSTRNKEKKAKLGTCCCQVEKESSYSNSGICQAVEYIDGGLLLCKERIENSVLLQPSLKIPATNLCKEHRSKALAHGWCPGCGCFCSMGTFMECRRDHTRHHFHSECISEINNVVYCPHCGEDASRSHKVTNVIPEDLELITPKELQLQRQIKLPIALLETVEDTIVASLLDHQYETTKKRARMGGKLYLQMELDSQEKVTSESYSVTLKNGKTINSDLLPVGPTRKTLTAALKCINTFKSKRIGFCPKNLYLPALQGDLMKVIALLVEGFDPNHRFPEHNFETAMHAAATKGHHAILYVLLQAGGNCNAKDEDTQTPLMCAASSKQLDCLKQLVFHGADVTCKDDEGTAALHIASKDGFLDGVCYLTSLADTDVNIQDDGGWTPLVWAAEAKHLDVVQYLLDRGCDPNIKDQEGNCGLHWAAYAGAHDIIKLFIERNCDVNAVNHNGDTPLHIAAREDRYESVVTLLMRKANTLLKNREKDTALDCCDTKSNVYLALQVNQKIRQAAALRTVRSERILSKDISRGREARPIQVVNAVDDFSFPSDFLYVANCCEKSSLNIDRRIIHMKGCSCDDDCSLDSCFCAQSSTKCWYNKNGKLVDEFNYQDPPLIFECGRACNCWMSCKNRVVQHGIRCHLQLFRTKKMGWGLRSLQKIPKGTFICEYAGELISDEEADRRQDDSYLFDLDNREGDVYCIDARYYGNISRFINHLCDPNIVPVRIFIDHHDLRFPRIVFFTSRDVNAYEELGFDYGDKFWAIKSKYFNCCCGSPYCKHPLPRPDQEPEETDEEIIVD